MEEYFDIVDENNEPTGQTAARPVVHATGAWHRSVHIYFIKNSGDNIYFLVHLRAKTKDLHPNCWDSRFGGHLQAGQTVATSVTREAEEETGLKIAEADLLPGPIMKKERFPNNEFVYSYFYRFTGDISELKFIDEEVQAVRWLSAGEIIKEMIAEPENWAGKPENFTKILDYLKSNLSFG